PLKTTRPLLVLDCRGRRHASCFSPSAQHPMQRKAYVMVNRRVFSGADASRGAAQEPSGGRRLGTRSGRAALLCTAMVGGALAAGPRFTATPPPGPPFTRYDIASGVLGRATQGITGGDIDGAGRPDIVVGGDNSLVCYHTPDWAPTLIAGGLK